MNICDIEIKGSEAIIAVASLEDQALSHVALATKKIGLDDDDEAAKPTQSVGARLARENGVSVANDFECAFLFPGKPRK